MKLSSRPNVVLSRRFVIPDCAIMARITSTIVIVSPFVVMERVPQNRRHRCPLVRLLTYERAGIFRCPVYALPNGGVVAYSQRSHRLAYLVRRRAKCLSRASWRSTMTKTSPIGWPCPSPLFLWHGAILVLANSFHHLLSQSSAFPIHRQTHLTHARCMVGSRTGELPAPQLRKPFNPFWHRRVRHALIAQLSTRL